MIYTLTLSSLLRRSCAFQLGVFVFCSRSVIISYSITRILIFAPLFARNNDASEAKFKHLGQLFYLSIYSHNYHRRFFSLYMPSKNYPVPAETLEKTLLVKKSRFIACATLIISRDQAKTFLHSKKTEYPDARHHCWAYLLGNPASASNAAMNDDGEPSGTAGKQILNVIRHKNIGDVMVRVTRYFGGIKLGAGGLTRAYSGATELVLSELKLKQQIFLAEVFIRCNFAQEQMMRHWAGLHDATIDVLQYSSQVELKITLPDIEKNALKKMCLANNVSVYKDDN